MVVATIGNNVGLYSSVKVVAGMSYKTQKLLYILEYSGHYNYPACWDELWNNMIENSEAEELSDFGFGEELTSTEK